MGRIRRKHSAVFKSMVVLKVLRGRETMSEIVSEYGMHPNQVSKWKTQAEEILKAGFAKKDLSSQLKEKEHLEEQCALLQLNRSTYYYKPVEILGYDQYMLNRTDEIYTRWPFYGYRGAPQSV